MHMDAGVGVGRRQARTPLASVQLHSGRHPDGPVLLVRHHCVGCVYAPGGHGATIALQPRHNVQAAAVHLDVVEGIVLLQGAEEREGGGLSAHASHPAGTAATRGAESSGPRCPGCAAAATAARNTALHPTQPQPALTSSSLPKPHMGQPEERYWQPHPSS